MYRLNGLQQAEQNSYSNEMNDFKQKIYNKEILKTGVADCYQQEEMTMTKNTLKVDTPNGKIKAKTTGDENYPGIVVSVPGHDAVLVEFDSSKGSFRVHAWDGKEEDPILSIDLPSHN